MCGSGFLYTTPPMTSTRTVTIKECHAPHRTTTFRTAGLSADSSPAENDKKPPNNFDDDVDKLFCVTTPDQRLIGTGAGFAPQHRLVHDMVGNSSALDGELFLRLSHTKKMKESKVIVTAGNKKVCATAIGTCEEASSTRLTGLLQFASPSWSFLDWG